jgi:hypothetical protein
MWEVCSRQGRPGTRRAEVAIPRRLGGHEPGGTIMIIVDWAMLATATVGNILLPLACSGRANTSRATVTARTGKTDSFGRWGVAPRILYKINTRS